MAKKTIYASNNLSAVHVLQGIAMTFLAAGAVLAYKMQAAPVPDTAVTSHATHVGWAIGLAVLATITPIVACIYARRVVAKIAVSDDGQTAFIKSSLFGSAAKAWRISDLHIESIKQGDASGEEDFGVPRAELLARNGQHERKYTVAIKDAKQLAQLQALIRP